jgi:hypothetical protein
MHRAPCSYLSLVPKTDFALEEPNRIETASHS